MNMTQQDVNGHRLAVVIFWLAAGAFALGSGEFAAMSLLPYFATTLGISEDVAGHAISAYALGVVIGAPLLAMMASRLPRKHTLIALMMLFCAGNLMTLTATHPLFMDAARFISGLPHGAFFGIAMLFAAEMAGPGRRAWAVSRVLLGLTIANVLGVPMINALGQWLGWRVSFGMIALMAALTFVMIWKTAPNIRVSPSANAMKELRALGNRQVLLTLLMGAIGFGGVFSVYAYYSAAYIETTGASQWTVSLPLMLFGVGATFGSYLAGRAEHRLMYTALLLQLVIALSAGGYALAIGNAWLMGLAILTLGMGTSLVVPLQTRLMDVAGDAQTLAAAMNHAAFNTANALGPWAAGLTLASGLGWSSTGWVGIAFALGGMLVGFAILFSEHRAGQRAVETGP